MTDYSDITQYQQDTITQIWLSLVQYAFLPVSAQIAQTEAKTHIYTPPQALALSAKGTTSVPALVFTGDQRPLIKTSLYIHIYVYQNITCTVTFCNVLFIRLGKKSEENPWMTVKTFEQNQPFGIYHFSLFAQVLELGPKFVGQRHSPCSSASVQEHNGF